MLPLYLLLACVGAPKDTGVADTDATTDASTDPPVDSGTGVDTAPPPADPVCGVRPSKNWVWRGECPGMGTPCTLAVDDCSLSFTYRLGMDMGMPHTGHVDGTNVLFDDGPSMSGCTGTLVSADDITGSCAGGCTFDLSRG